MTFPAFLIQILCKILWGKNEYVWKKITKKEKGRGKKSYVISEGGGKK